MTISTAAVTLLVSVAFAIIPPVLILQKYRSPTTAIHAVTHLVGVILVLSARVTATLLSSSLRCLLVQLLGEKPEQIKILETSVRKQTRGYGSGDHYFYDNVEVYSTTILYRLTAAPEQQQQQMATKIQVKTHAPIPMDQLRVLPWWSGMAIIERVSTCDIMVRICGAILMGLFLSSGACSLYAALLAQDDDEPSNDRPTFAALLLLYGLVMIPLYVVGYWFAHVRHNTEMISVEDEDLFASDIGDYAADVVETEMVSLVGV